MRPCLAPNAKNSSEKGRARPRSLDSRRRRGRQTLPMPWPTGTALAQAPDRSRRRTSAWIGFALPYRRLPEIGTKLVTWGAAPR